MKINTYAVNCNDAWLNTEGDDISGSYVKYKDHQNVVAELEAKCEELAAENVAMKTAAIFLSDEAAEIYRRWNLIQQPDGDIIDMETIQDLSCACHETPATDSFLAEARAQGVDSAVGTIMVHMNHQHVAVAEALHILRTHAAQLRQGGAV